MRGSGKWPTSDEDYETATEVAWWVACGRWLSDDIGPPFGGVIEVDDSIGEGDIYTADGVTYRASTRTLERRIAWPGFAVLHPDTGEIICHLTGKAAELPPVQMYVRSRKRGDMAS